MPQTWHRLLRISAGLGAIAALLVGLWSVPSWNPLLRTGSGVPGLHYFFKELTLYLSVMLSGGEVLLLGGLAYYRVMPRLWAWLGMAVFGAIALSTTIMLIR